MVQRIHFKKNLDDTQSTQVQGVQILSQCIKIGINLSRKDFAIVSAEDPIIPKLEASRKELLDLELRNPLLNYRTLKTRGEEIMDELSSEVIRLSRI